MARAVVSHHREHSGLGDRPIPLKERPHAVRTNDTGRHVELHRRLEDLVGKPGGFTEAADIGTVGKDVGLEDRHADRPDDVARNGEESGQAVGQRLVNVGNGDSVDFDGAGGLGHTSLIQTARPDVKRFVNGLFCNR